MESGGGFHRNEAISAVQDEEQFYGEDEDYDDLYNDVNVGEGFYQSAPQRPAEEELPPPPPRQQPPPAADSPDKVQIPGVVQEPKVEKPPDRSGGFPEPPPVQAQTRPPLVQMRPDLAQQQQPLSTNFQNESLPRQGGNFTGGNVNVNPNPNLNGGGGGNNFGGGSTAGNNFGGGNTAGNNFGSGSNNFSVGGGNYNSGGGGGGTTTLFVGDLHWWTTDADLESELVKYGPVKEVKFFDEKASGKSKGYAQVDFFDPAAATACKEGMNGHLFNGRPCVVAFSSPYGVRRMGEAQVSRNQQAMAQNQNQNQNQSAMANKGRGGGVGGGGGPGMGGNFGGRGGGGGGNWGRGGGGVGGRGPMGGNMRNRMGPVGGRGIMGNGGGMVAPPPPVMHPGMLGQGFDYGAAAMGRMGGGYGGFPAGPAAGPFPGMMPSFPPVVAPHVNPAFFGRGMPGGGIGMWQDPGMGGWGGEEQSSYGEDAGSDHQYGEGGINGKERVAERGPDRDWPGGSERRHEREKDVGGGQEWSERRHRDDREIGRDRDRGRDWEREKERDRDGHREREREREREKYRDDRDRYGDHYRHRERDDEWDRGRSSGRSRSREVETAKRRRGSE